MSCHRQLSGHAMPSAIAEPTDLAQYRRDMLGVTEAQEIDQGGFLWCVALIAACPVAVGFVLGVLMYQSAVHQWPMGMS